MGDPGGHHVEVALKIAPEGGHDAHAQHRGSQGHNAVDRLGVADGVFGQGAGQNGHAEKADKAQGEEGGEGHPEHPLHLIAAAQGIGLGNGFAESHGKAGGGDGQEEIVDVVCGVIIPHHIVGKNVSQRDAVDGADDLHKDGADGQNGRTAEEGALFLRFRQWNAAFPGPVARRDKTLLFYMSLTGKR